MTLRAEADAVISSPPLASELLAAFAWPHGKWFSGKDAGKAESYYNDLANAEAMKYEKEYIPDGDEEESSLQTIVVVSLVMEIQGDSTK